MVVLLVTFHGQVLTFSEAIYRDAAERLAIRDAANMFRFNRKETMDFLQRVCKCKSRTDPEPKAIRDVLRNEDHVDPFAAMSGVYMIPEDLNSEAPKGDHGLPMTDALGDGDVSINAKQISDRKRKADAMEVNDDRDIIDIRES